MKLQLCSMAFFAMVFAACSGYSDKSAQNMGLSDQTAPENSKDQTPGTDKIATLDSVGAPSGSTDNTPSAKSNNPDWDKKIIKTADLELQLEDYKKFNSSVHASLKQFGAYIAAEKQTENDYRIENTLSIKVPVDHFDDLVNSFTGDGIKTMEKNISAEDVTGQVVDTKARLQAKLAVREKYLELLKQAKNMDDILQVQNEINEIQENIEAANGRIEYLQHASAYSTINLTYYQFINGRTADDETPDFFTRLTKAFSTGTTFVLNLFLFCISIWPLIIAGLFAWFYLKKLSIKKTKAG